MLHGRSEFSPRAGFRLYERAKPRRRPTGYARQTIAPPGKARYFGSRRGPPRDPHPSPTPSAGPPSYERVKTLPPWRKGRRSTPPERLPSPLGQTSPTARAHPGSGTVFEPELYRAFSGNPGSSYQTREWHGATDGAPVGGGRERSGCCFEGAIFEAPANHL